ncbi:hypothetical protein VIGAN_10042000 [Vigna angularis var. angularis]|uniref:Uncharacterized protein n=1 Tax=Vigna angularis var. angularis TaxID=157739 RepID=A0A0S3T1M2_PHAAN|nr:hypothetical protein VIGAN_10042000 [Vigna angularis var. angularis]
METRWGWRVVEKHFLWLGNFRCGGDEIAGNSERRKRKETKQGRRGREGNKIRKTLVLPEKYISRRKKFKYDTMGRVSPESCPQIMLQESMTRTMSSVPTPAKDAAYQSGIKQPLLDTHDISVNGISQLHEHSRYETNFVNAQIKTMSLPSNVRGLRFGRGNRIIGRGRGRMIQKEDLQNSTQFKFMYFFFLYILSFTPFHGNPCLYRTSPTVALSGRPKSSPATPSALEVPPHTIVPASFFALNFILFPTLPFQHYLSFIF